MKSRRVMLLLAGLFLIAVAFRVAAGRSQWRPNVILICVDGCRADHLSAWGYARPTSPWIDQKAAQGVVFLNNYAQANESLYSHASMFTSRYASEIGPLDYTHFRIPPGLPTLASILKAYGYNTGGFTGGGHVRHEFGFKQGFDTYFDAGNFDGYIASEPRAVEWIRTHRDAPMFVFLHGYDCHRPYRAPSIFGHLYDPQYRGSVDKYLSDFYILDRIYKGAYYPQFKPPAAFTYAAQLNIDPSAYLQLMDGSRSGRLQGVPLSPADIQHIISHYDSSISYADTWLGRFFADIGHLGMDASNTLIVILADHGEDLMDHGFFNHRTGLAVTNMHVPLVFWGCGVGPAAVGKRYDFPTANVDVVPTLLSLLNVKPLGEARGYDLAAFLRAAPPVSPHLAARQVYAQGVLSMSALFESKRQLICSGAASGSAAMRALLQGDGVDEVHFSLYDLAQDAAERRNVLLQPAYRADLERLRAGLASMEAVSRRSVPAGAVTPLSPELVEELRRNGYWK